MEPGKETEVALTVPLEELRWYHNRENRWVLDDGDYAFQICADCETVLLSESISIAGENPSCPYPLAVNEAYMGADLSRMTAPAFEGILGQKIPEPTASFPVHMESRFTDLQQSFMGKYLFRAVLSVAKNQLRKAKKMPEGVEKDNCMKGALFLKRVLESNSVRTMSMTGGKALPYNFGQGFVELTNGHLLRGAKCFLRPIRVPKLPKEEE